MSIYVIFIIKINYNILSKYINTHIFSIIFTFSSLCSLNSHDKIVVNI